MEKQSIDLRPILASREVRAVMGTKGRPLSNTSLWRYVKQGIIPEPHHIKTRAVWYEDEILAAKERLLQPPRAA